MNRMHNNTVNSATVLAIALLSGMTAQAESVWQNYQSDNDFSNTNNWQVLSTNNDFRNISLVNPDHPIVSAGQSNVVDDVRVGINGDGQLDITGGYLRSNRGGGDDRLGYGNTAVINQSGGTYEIAHDLAIGLGNGSDATFNLSGGLLSQQGGKLTIAEGGTGVLNITGGAMETRYYADIYGTGTFSVQGSGATSIGIGSQGSGTAYWNQRSGGTLEIMIDSGGVTPIVIDDYDDGGDANVTFAYGAQLDVSFMDGYVESNTWTVMTWEGTVNDLGLLFSTNVDTEVWSFAITNNELQVTYGMGSEPPPTNLPPTGPRSLYWASSATNMDMTAAENWVTNNGSGTFSPATWGLWEGDTVFIGDNGANPVEGPVYEATYDGLTAKDQGALRIGQSRTGVLNFNAGDLDFNRNWQCRIGYGTRGHGTLNMNGGTLEVESLQLGLGGTSDGTLNLNDGRFTCARGFTLSGRSTSVSVGDGGLGTNIISGGEFEVRFGLVLGNNSGTGLFSVEGSDASIIGIGTKNSGSDGYWLQNTGSTLKARVDDGGLTPITVVGYDGDGGDLTFAAGSILDIGWEAGITNYGVFDLINFNGTVTDNGLMLDPGVDTNLWSFAFVDSDNDSTNDTLRIIADPGSTDQGTPLLWLWDYGLTEADEFEDNDSDGLLTWEEYIAGTIPTDENSVLKFTSIDADGSDYIITWQSVAGRSYSIITNTSLAFPEPGIVTSNIVGAAGETSVTSSIPSAPMVFLEVGVE